MTPSQLHILQHSLGLDQFGQGSMYRNHFVTGIGSDDWQDCCYLSEKGLMKDHGVHNLAGGDHCFSVTEFGIAEMRKASPQPPKLTRSQIRYRDFLNADSGMKFIDWLKWHAKIKA